MRKLFISCPMNGRNDDEIKHSMNTLHKMAEIINNEEFEVIDSFIESPPPVFEEADKTRIWYLGESIKKLASADVIIGCDCFYGKYPGCELEMQVAESYKIERINLDYDMMMKIVDR